MARVKLSEHKAKSILMNAFGLPYTGVRVEVDAYSDLLGHLKTDRSYVVKVDEGMKKRFKNGLVALNKKKSEIPEVLKQFKERGYSKAIVEEMIKYSAEEERYFSVERVRNGFLINYSEKGGVEIEDNFNLMRSLEIFSDGEIEAQLNKNVFLSRHLEFVKTILKAVESYHFSFLEINPLLFIDDKPVFLDCACEVDGAGAFFVANEWSEADVVESNVNAQVDEILAVKKLAEGSPASLKLDLINPNGSIFLLLSGGGASIALADEVYDLGYGKELANYGEYSGNPNDEETYVYTKNVLSLLLKSKASKKVLIIGGGVANFTDIRKTFKGIIQALAESAEKLRSQGVKVFVRRGGPYQREGLENMRIFLESEGLLGVVAGPEMMLTEIVRKGVETIN